MNGWLGRRAVRLALIAGALLAGAAGAGFATNVLTATPTSVIQACRSNENGLLRMLASAPASGQKGDDARYATRCRPGEQAVSWNVQGVKGDPGPAGPQGPKGDPGSPGSGGTGIASLDQLNGLDCSVSIPGNPAPFPGKLSVTWTLTGVGNDLANYASVPSFACKPLPIAPPPTGCPSVPNGTATCAANDGVVTSIACNAGYYQPAGRDARAGCAPNARTNATRTTAIDIGTISCSSLSLPPIADSIAGAGDEAWYHVSISVSPGCPSKAGLAWVNPSGTLAYGIDIGLGGNVSPIISNMTTSFGPSSLNLPPMFTGVLDAYLHVAPAGGAAAGGSFTATLSAL